MIFIAFDLLLLIVSALYFVNNYAKKHQKFPHLSDFKFKEMTREERLILVFILFFITPILLVAGAAVIDWKPSSKLIFVFSFVLFHIAILARLTISNIKNSDNSTHSNHIHMIKMFLFSDIFLFISTLVLMLFVLSIYGVI